MGPYIIAWNRGRVFKTNCGRAKMTKNGPKWPKNTVENDVMSFLWNCFKMRVLMIHLHSVKIGCLAKILSSSYSQKCLLANEISLFFNHQYFFNRSSSDFDIWHVDRHE